MVDDRGLALLSIARGAIAKDLGERSPSFEPARWLQEPGATFVTLQLHGGLRGCVGSLVAKKTLREDVEANARAAAFHDPRFAPLSRREYPGIEIEVSLLSPLEKLAFESQEHLLRLLRPGVDGVVLEYGWQRGTFLPQVWEQLPDPKTFLAHLKQKAGLTADFWSDDIQISLYSVEKWREHECSNAHR
ncbi:MAG: AmmeMemoRadiSam system protein A [Holophagaceae bacterium]|nr:AmmeMemoRadiSam system protein A [Holophagaceae bacterium]